MNFFKYCLLILVLFLSACGTYTPIPSHGGGKRFALEQTLISATMRKVINEIPINNLKDKSIVYEVTIINDEGGGAIYGGRPFLTDIASSQRTISNGAVASSIGFSAGRADSVYSKDMTFNNCDGKQFSNLLATYLVRNNVLLNPNPETEIEPDYLLEVIVDVLGTWRKRTDWLVQNKESLMAVVAIEYVITPTNNSSEKKVVGRLSYEAEYTEKYIGWIGPTEEEITLKKSKYGDVISSFGTGSSDVTNLKRLSSSSFYQKPEVNPTIQLPPKTK
jgi:hypothetical protein